MHGQGSPHRGGQGVHDRGKRARRLRPLEHALRLDAPDQPFLATLRTSLRAPVDPRSMKSVSTGNSSLAAVAGRRLARSSKFLWADRVMRDGTVIGNWRGGLARAPLSLS